MTARLRLMREDEFEPFVERSRTGYAEDMIRHGGWEPEAARRKAHEDFAQLFPRGFASGVELRVVVDEKGQAIGHLVYAEREQHGTRLAFVYDLEIHERHRGRGHGRTAMELVEAEVRERGHDRLQLNVFGGNEPARALYRSLGFEELAVHMGKTLS